MSEILWNDMDALRSALNADLKDSDIARVQGRAKEMAEEFIDAVDYHLKYNLAETLAYYVKEMAGRAVNALLEGNESEIRRWLNCDPSGYTGRSDGSSGQGHIAEQHPVIHGKIFDAGCIKLRRMIAEAHADMIQNERIKDLEDQLASLLAQHNKMECERNEWRSTALSYR